MFLGEKKVGKRLRKIKVEQVGLRVAAKIQKILEAVNIYEKIRRSS